MSPPPQGGEHEKECLISHCVPRSRQRRATMEIVYRCVCGIDVHKKSVTACVRWEGEGQRRQEQKRKFSTFTRDLLAMADWLRECGVTHRDGIDGGVLETGVAHLGRTVPAAAGERATRKGDPR